MDQKKKKKEEPKEEILYKEYLMPRRNLMKLTTMTASGLYLASMDEMAYADPRCTTILHKSTSDKEDATAKYAGLGKDRDFFYWIDGPFAPEQMLIPEMVDSYKSIGTHRQRLAIYIDLPQTSEDYLETVFIEDPSGLVIASQRFTPAMANSNGKAPYIIFDNMYFDLLNPAFLKTGKGYGIYAVRRFKSKSHDADSATYYLNIQRPRQSRLDYSHMNIKMRSQLPQLLIDEMLEGNHGLDFIDDAALRAGLSAKYSGDELTRQVARKKLAITMNSGDDPDLPEGGMLSTPYQTYADMPLHNVDSRIVSINYETGDFSFLIRKMHGDQVKSEEVDGVSVDISNHWMRYFLVLDPVGRVLAGRRRKAGEGELPGDDGKDWHKVSGSKDSIEEGKGISLTNAELNRFKDTLYAGEDENHIFGIGHTNLSIVDCPYVQVLTEDNKDAMARVTHRLR